MIESVIKNVAGIIKNEVKRTAEPIATSKIIIKIKRKTGNHLIFPNDFLLMLIARPAKVKIKNGME